MKYEKNGYGSLKLAWLGGFQIQRLENGGTEHFPWKLRQISVWLVNSPLWEKGCMMENNISRGDAFGFYIDQKVKTGERLSYIAAVLHFRPDKDLVMVEDEMRSQLLAGVYTETIFSIPLDGI